MTAPERALEVVRHPRARRAKLAVNAASGQVRLTLPPRAPLKPALAWAETQRAWIDAQRARLPEARPWVNNSDIRVGDEQLTIRWLSDAPRRVVRQGDQLIVGGPEEMLPRRIAAWLRAQALELLSADTANYAAKAGVTVARVQVGDARGRWGSCTATGAIRYSWRLICAPVFVRRQVAAHEVAHRVHMHHGPAFHALVRNLYGADPEPARLWLREYGAGLHWIGRVVE